MNSYKFFPLLLLLSLAGCDNSLFHQLRGNSAPCKNLHKVADIDDLLKQIYDNIDSTCLFDMPSDELENIWEIKVFDYVNTKEKKELNKQRWDYHSQGVGLYAVKFEQKSELYYQIIPTEKFSNANLTWGGSLANGNFPKFLPPAFVPTREIQPNYPPARPEDAPKIFEKTSFSPWTDYVWYNSQKSIDRPFLVLSSSSRPYIGVIMFHKNALHGNLYQAYFK